MPSKAALDFASKLDAMTVGEGDCPQDHRARIAALLDEHVRSLVSLASHTGIKDDVARSILDPWKPA
jgi:hypothetical protein